MAGAVPVFAEIDETLCLNPAAIEKVITPRTRAVMLVHMCGSMAQIDEIADLCKKHNLLLIEDTAQAIGATFRGRALGTFGKIAVFSFDFFKIITAGEGGAILTDDQSVYEIASQFSDHGHNHTGNNRGAEPHPLLGTNYRISELHAAIGLAQFRKLPYILERQRANKSKLVDAFYGFPQISFRKVPDVNGDSATFLDFFLEDEQSARKVLKTFDKHGVSYAYWYDNNYHYFKNWDHLKMLKTASPQGISALKPLQDYKTLQLPESDKIMSRLISIQIRITWTDSDLQLLSENIKKALREALL